MSARLCPPYGITATNVVKRSSAGMIRTSRTLSSLSSVPSSSIPIYRTLEGYREWRRKAHDEKKSVGFVATMGALHDGHLSLVKKSLEANDHTVLSIFVNPAQFAPHEDLTTYPRTLPRDLELLESMSMSVPGSGDAGPAIRKPSAVFLPTVSQMYPSGISQDTAAQKGTFVEVKGYGHQMEGKTRPAFFRGVATVVTKLFNAIEPTRTYFGQKDIQQALLLRRMTRDLLMSHPSPENLHIVPTARDKSGLALSSRNAYLTAYEREHIAPALNRALHYAHGMWSSSAPKAEILKYAAMVVAEAAKHATEKVDVRLDYIEFNDPETFEPLPDDATQSSWQAGDHGRPVILSGAMWLGKTRLIDNLVLGDARRLGVMIDKVAEPNLYNL
ncbi:Pantoate-beta-alanine ligase [Obba rivulosa]|uniref:Pantoate--beta-alanine ligase n=1 Tax=Obba rivulosa TaxID=1052685 RepID=A0A8E2DLY8_9APHY|nr:Pantoate-beta-alanine ligase [Obba rivulosa]